jgi:hypothetical protein
LLASGALAKEKNMEVLRHFNPAAQGELFQSPPKNKRLGPAQVQRAIRAALDQLPTVDAVLAEVQRAHPGVTLPRSLRHRIGVAIHIKGLRALGASPLEVLRGLERI